MQTHSTAYAAAVTSSNHRAIRRAELWSPGGAHVRDLPATGGSVATNYGAAVRRQVTLDVPATPDLIPYAETDQLHPLAGFELRLHAGVRLSGAATEDGSEEWLPVGCYPITAAPLKRGSDGVSIQISGDDRSENVSSQGWVYPYQTSTGDVVAAVEALLTDRWPGIPLDLDDLTGEVNSQVFEGSGSADPWRDARALVSDVGADLAFDADGACRARPVTDPATATPLRVYGYHGLRVLTKIDRPLTRDDVKTGVVVWAQHPDNSEVWTSVLWDMNPASPTYSGMTADGDYVGSPLGRRPKWVDSSRVGNQSTADALARAELLRLRGKGDGYTVALPPDASIDVGDVLAVSFDEHESARNTLVESINFPWDIAEQMSLTLRTTSPLEDT